MELKALGSGPDEAALLADLRATFPALEKVRPLREMARSGCDHGAWIVDLQACMPDGQRIFLVPLGAADELPGYTCWVHDGFLAWLEIRGWHLETYDYGSYMVVPLASLLHVEA